MTQFSNLSLLRVSPAVLLFALIAAGSAHAKDTVGEASKGAEASATVPGALKTRQIAVEPAVTPSDARVAETSQTGRAPEVEAQDENETPADDGDDVTQAPKDEAPSEPQSAPKTLHGPSHVYVLRYARAYGHGYGYPGYQPSYGYDDDYEPARYGYGHRRYQHCDD